MYKKIIIIVCLCLISFPSWAAPKVVVTIKPIHALVADIMKGVAKPALLISAKESPHHFHMTPAKAELMSRADLFIWVGPQLETILEKPIENLVKRGQKISLLSIPTIALHHQDNGNVDAHIWLDPENAKTIVAFLTQTLSEIDPEHKSTYEKNAVGLLNDLDKLSESLNSELRDLQGQSYFVYHDAYQYFERAFGLERGIPIVLDVSGGLRASQRMKLENLVQEKSISCIFAEPQHGQKVVKNLAGQLGLKMGVLDDLGVETDRQEGNSYIMMMQSIAASLKQCLK